MATNEQGREKEDLHVRSYSSLNNGAASFNKTLHTTSTLLVTKPSVAPCWKNNGAFFSRKGAK